MIDTETILSSNTSKGIIILSLKGLHKFLNEWYNPLSIMLMGLEFISFLFIFLEGSGLLGKVPWCHGASVRAAYLKSWSSIFHHYSLTVSTCLSVLWTWTCFGPRHDIVFWRKKKIIGTEFCLESLPVYSRIRAEKSMIETWW